MLPIYESIVNSIISLSKIENDKKTIRVFIERIEAQKDIDLFGNQLSPIKTITIIDNGIGFTTEKILKKKYFE